MIPEAQSDILLFHLLQLSTLIVCLGMSMIGNDDVGLEEGVAVIAIKVNSWVRWDVRQN
jgi:hypothetical protein